MELLVRRCDDFEVNGLGDAPQWERAAWQTLQHVESGPARYASRAKVLYSEKGMYFLYDCQDEVLTATLTRDNDDIYNEDVIELFLWTDQAQEFYFEYELSPLDVELDADHSESSGDLLRLDSVALRGRAKDPSRGQCPRRAASAAGEDRGLDGGVLRALCAAQGLRKLPAAAGHQVAGQPLPHRLRSRPKHPVGLVPGDGREFS